MFEYLEIRKMDAKTGADHIEDYLAELHTEQWFG